MKLTKPLIFLCLLVFWNCKNLKNQEEKWTPIFNQKNLEGWIIKGNNLDTSKNHWIVKNGIIHCITNGDKNHPGSWLVFDKDLEDFEFKFKFKSNNKLTGNSGVQLRSKLDLENNKMQGPQIDIHPPKPFRTGLLYDETDGVKHWLYPKTESWRLDAYPTPNNWVYHENDWNEMYIKCQGTKVITKLNNVVITDFNGKNVLNDEIHKNMGVGMKGKIAFQLHRKHDIEILFKDIQLKK